MNKTSRGSLNTSVKQYKKSSTAKAFVEAQKVIDRYNQAVGKTSVVNYRTASTSQPAGTTHGNISFTNKVW